MKRERRGRWGGGGQGEEEDVGKTGSSGRAPVTEEAPAFYHLGFFFLHPSLLSGDRREAPRERAGA